MTKLKFNLFLPEDTTQIENIIAEFMARKVIKECTPQEVNAIIQYLESKQTAQK